MPKVSVILPTYNRASFIGRAIQSVLNQTYRDFELIIVDDGSTDDTERVVKSFSDERIYYVKHEVNKGAAAARNTGLKMARGEFIAFQDSDDEWLPYKLQKQVEVFERVHHKVGVVYSNMNIVDEYGKKYLWSPIRFAPEDGIVYDKLLLDLIYLTGKTNFRGLGIDLVTSLIRKDCFCKVGMFDEKLPRWIDMELFLWISKLHYFYCIDEPLVNSLVLIDGITTNIPAGIKAKALIVSKYIDDLTKNKKALSDILYDIGCSWCYIGNHEAGKEYLFKSVKVYPWNLKYIWTLTIAMLGKDVFKVMTALKQKLLDR